MTLRYLLDTNILSEPLRKTPDAHVIARIHDNDGALCTATLVWHELRFGALRLHEGQRRVQLLKYLDDVVVASLPLLPYDAAAASWHADARAALEKRGRTPPFVDGMIAAIAATNGLVLVTNNVADYRGFGDVDVVRWHA